MLGTFVPFRAVFRQPLTFTISLLGSGLSFTMTLRFCQRHWPEDGGLILVALGLLWELAKLHMAARGLAAVVHGARVSERLGGLGLLALALTLATGSVGASLGCLMQVEAQDQQRTLASSQAYARAVHELEALDGQLALLNDAAAYDLARGYRKRALETSQKIEELRPRRDVAARAVRGLEIKGDATAAWADGEFTGFLGVAGQFDPRRLRFGLHLAVAALLEVVSMVGMFLLERASRPEGRMPSDRAARSRSRSSSKGRAPSLIRDRSPGQAVEARPYTHRLTYRYGRAEGLLNQLGDSRRYQACRELVRRIGDYCLKIGWTDGVITEAQLRTLRTGASWRATQGYLCLLLDVGALTRREDGCYELAYFLDENPSVQTREKYAREQREHARSRKRRERSRNHGDSASNQHADGDDNTAKSTTYVECHAKPTNTHLNDANAATHRIITHAEATAAVERFEETLPWAKYLHSEPAACAEEEVSESPPRNRDPRRRPRSAATPATRKCIPANFRDAKEALNLGSVIEGLRKQGIQDKPRLAERIFGELRRAGVTRAQLRYADHCLQVRRRKVEIDNPLAYWAGILRRQAEAARTGGGPEQLAA